MIIGCKNSDPTYNPFDNEFEINTAELIKSKVDTISAGCGYFNLTKKINNHLVYYQIFAEEPKIIVAKGLIIPLDTISIAEHHFTDNLLTDVTHKNSTFQA